MEKLGIALSGGGARGSAHIGMLQALNENGIYPDAISGTSAGALIGALYCQGYSPLHILELSKSEDFLDIFRITVFPSKWNKLTRIRELLKRSIPVDKFEAMRIPFYVCVTNLNTGRSEYIETGELINYVIASCAVPIIFNPIVIGNITYVDGGVLNNLPIEPLQKLEMKIMGVSICPHKELESINGVRAISERLFHLEVWNNTSSRLEQCDIAVDMIKTFDYGMFDVSHSEELYQIGYETTIAKMAEIKAQLSM